MDRHSGKRGPKVLVKKSHGGEAENSQFCKRIGCCGRLKYPQNTNTSSSSPTSEGNGIARKTSASASVSLSSSSSSRSSALRLLNSRVGVRGGERSLKHSSVSDSPRINSCSEPNSTGKNSKKRVSDAERSLSSVGRQCSPAISTMTMSSGRSNSSRTGSSSSSSFSGRNSSAHISDNGDPGGRSLFPRSNSQPHNLSTFFPSAVGSSSSTPPAISSRFPILEIDGQPELVAIPRRQAGELPREEALLQMTRILRGLTVDRHRDMRLDIDGMSYEELLALEERMGTVSTPVSEEELSKCLQRSIFRENSSGFCGDSDDFKCSICQEEYVAEEEIGMLSKCCHGYHATCITQWLRIKNWCPVCKASAAAASP